jgi:hypothetical protein
MMRSERKVPTPAILIPAFAVPYAAPMATISRCIWGDSNMRISSTSQLHGRWEEGHTAAATPPNPRNGAKKSVSLSIQMDTPYIGHCSDSDMMTAFTVVNSWRVLPTAIRTACQKFVSLGLGHCDDWLLILAAFALDLLSSFVFRLSRQTEDES